MDATIFAILVQDGIVNGAIYALLALSLVLVFAVTRVIFIPQGELVAFGALTYAALDSGVLPGSLWLLGGLSVAGLLAGLWARRTSLDARGVFWLAAETVLLPALVIAVTVVMPRRPGVWVEAVLALAIVTPMAPLLYRVAFAPLAEASVLILLIAAVGVHLALAGLGLVFFGAEGSRARGFSDAHLALGPLDVAGQSLWILGATALAIIGLLALFELTLSGKALRATAVNRLGARLVGIPTADAGRFAFALAGFIGALSGVLIVPLTTLYYDSGFTIGLKGFVAAIVGGLASYPVAAVAAIMLGVVESFAAFWASAFKSVIVFAAIIPVLLWLSLRAGPVSEEE